MIPLIAHVVVDQHHGRPIRLWLPLFLVWLLLAVVGLLAAALFLLLAPFIFVACLILWVIPIESVRVNPFNSSWLYPFTAAWGLCRVIVALGGVAIEIQSPEALVLVRVI